MDIQDRTLYITPDKYNVLLHVHTVMYKSTFQSSTDTIYTYICACVCVVYVCVCTYVCVCVHVCSIFIVIGRFLKNVAK